MTTLVDTIVPISDTNTSWQRFTVSYAFPVSFTQGLFDVENTLFRNTLTQNEAGKVHRVAFFIDRGVLNACPNLIQHIHNYIDAHSSTLSLIAEPMLLPGGEIIKSDLTHLQTMQSQVVEQHIDRHSYIVGIGGGALLDAVGFVAATSHRGIRHIRVPTTVLAQNDSGVGVKNGVNLYGQKNYLGSFTPPFAVLNDYEFIEQLSNRDKIAGMAEAVKVALIRDAGFFRWLEAHATALSEFESTAMQYMIRRCAELHMRQIGKGGDPFEFGSARPLDYGHWSAHRLESMTNYDIRHGEAVAIGIAIDARYAVLKQLIEPGTEDRICRLLETIGFTLWHAALLRENNNSELTVLQGISEFREHLGGELCITLLESIGKGIEVHEIDEPAMVKAIQWLHSRQSQLA